MMKFGKPITKPGSKAHVRSGRASGLRAKPRTMDEYLAGLDGEKRRALEKLRRTIFREVPAAEECMSYGLAAFRLNGRALIAFGAAEHHCAFYPMSSATVAAHAKDLRRFDTSKGTIRFQPERPLPVLLVRKLVRARVAESGVSTAGRKSLFGRNG